MKKETQSFMDDAIAREQLYNVEETPVFEALELSNLVGECVARLDKIAKASNVELNYEGERCSVFGSKENIEEVVYNLVGSAISGNKEGGHVWVKVYTNDGPTISVKDDGIGVPEEEGLALAVVKHIVELHKAKFISDNELGEGTEFKVVF
jgi:two-component system phosphate regulon sensor histidine kinase PhoR